MILLYNIIINKNIMNKKGVIISIISVLLVICIIVIAVNSNNKEVVNNDNTPTPIQNTNNVNFKSIPYYIDDQKIKIDGSKITYFGNDLKQDLNNDGLEDIAFLIVDNSEGSGVFYYVVAAINTGNGYVGTNAIFIGDRIAPQNINYDNNEIIVNYADRNVNEPFTTPPSVGASKYIRLENLKLIEDKR